MNGFIDSRRLALVMATLLCLHGCALHSKHGDEELLPDDASATPLAAELPQDPTNPDPFLASLKPDPYTFQVNAPLKPDYLALLEKANATMKAGKPDEAAPLYEQLIALNPVPSLPYLQLALISHEKQERKQAKQWAKKAVAANHLNYAAHNLLGVIAREEGKFDKAEKYYLAILDLWQGYPEAHLNLGILYDLYTGKPVDAIIHYEHYRSLITDEKEKRKVTAWIKDLERRIKSAPST